MRDGSERGHTSGTAGSPRKGSRAQAVSADERARAAAPAASIIPNCTAAAALEGGATCAPPGLRSLGCKHVFKLHPVCFPPMPLQEPT